MGPVDAMNMAVAVMNMEVAETNMVDVEVILEAITVKPAMARVEDMANRKWVTNLRGWTLAEGTKVRKCRITWTMAHSLILGEGEGHHDHHRKKDDNESHHGRRKHHEEDEGRSYEYGRY